VIPSAFESFTLRVAASSAAWGWLGTPVLAIPKAFGPEAATRTPFVASVGWAVPTICRPTHAWGIGGHSPPYVTVCSVLVRAYRR
jgi:hypothetical protein